MIYLDMDGVIVDFVGGCHKHFGWGDVEEEPSYRFWLRHFPKQNTITSDVEFWRTIDRSGATFWKNLPTYPWTQRLLEALMSTGQEITILSCVGNMFMCPLGKTEWLAKHVDYSIFRNRIFVSKPILKACVIGEGEILIDDLLAVPDEPWSFLWPMPWNTPGLTMSEKILQAPADIERLRERTLSLHTEEVLQP